MNPEFQYKEFHYSTDDVATLKTILECNSNRISAALSISMNELFQSIPEKNRALFIVEKCEDILVGATEPKGFNMKQFRFSRSPRK